MRLQDLLPDASVLLALEPEELAGVLLRVLASQEARSGSLNAYNFTLPGNLQGYPDHKVVGEAVMEAWVWLAREGLIAPRPGSKGDWVFVTRRGKKAADSQDWGAYRKADLLPRQFLHPAVASKVWATFLRGDYDTAVFQAYKELEVRVRDVTGEPPDCVGVALMRKAFDPSRGVLTDGTAPKAERESLAHLFAGAMGSYKNPHSHRAVAIDSEEACEMIMLASHLLKIVDERAEDRDV